jgi:predicted DNA-binding transcriptional regulator YafY
MRRADRLFQIVQILRSGRLLTAAGLAERLEVSERTIYRDIADLQSTGVPIDGEAGVGYLMRDGYDLPPLMFTREEVTALIIGARIVSAWGGARMALAAQDALDKIEAVLPDEQRNRAKEVQVYAFDHQMPGIEKENLDRMNTAISARIVLKLRYQDVSGQMTRRNIEPLGLFYWGKVWTLVAWCRLRRDFRMFRIDRIVSLAETADVFAREPGRTLQDFLARVVDEEGRDPHPKLPSST